MASFGLAMVQGQRNAQEAALGQLNTMSGMAKAATDAETQAQYFSPGAKALRKLTDEESVQAADNITSNREMIRNLNMDPYTYAPKVLDKTLGKSSPDSEWVIEQTPTGGVNAVEYSTTDATKGNGGVYRTLNLGGSKQQAVGVLAQNLTSTTLEQLKNIAALKAAADSSDMKRGEKRDDYMYNALFLAGPKNASDLLRTKITTAGGVTEAGIQAKAHIQGKLAELMDKGTDRTANAMLKLRGAGFEIGKDGESIKFNGMSLTDPNLPADVAAEAYAKFNDTLNTTGQAAGQGLPSITPGETVKSVAKANAMSPREAAEAKARGMRRDSFVPAVTPVAASEQPSTGEIRTPLKGLDRIQLMLGTNGGQLGLRTPVAVTPMTNDQILGITR